MQSKVRVGVDIVNILRVRSHIFLYIRFSFVIFAAKISAQNVDEIDTWGQIHAQLLRP